ncbi:hypothetical protein HDU76_005346, partial [Blyttiomyces sp. JEL0837]
MNNNRFSKTALKSPPPDTEKDDDGHDESFFGLLALPASTLPMDRVHNQKNSRSDSIPAIQPEMSVSTPPTSTE